MGLKAFMLHFSPAVGSAWLPLVALSSHQWVTELWWAALPGTELRCGAFNFCLHWAVRLSYPGQQKLTVRSTEAHVRLLLHFSSSEGKGPSFVGSHILTSFSTTFIVTFPISNMPLKWFINTFYSKLLQQISKSCNAKIPLVWKTTYCQVPFQTPGKAQEHSQTRAFH